MQNPFRFGGTLEADEIVDRQNEIAQVLETLRSGEKLFLIGPRRYGKTTILHAARRQGEDEGVKIFYFNAEAYPTLGDLTARIFSTVTAALVKPTAKARTSLRALFARVKPEISVNLLDQTVTGSLNIEAEKQAEQAPLLVEVLNGIESLARQQKQPAGIIIDEFQQVILLGGQSAEGQLRAAMQDHRRVGYVFAGSRTRMLAEMTNDHARPFYRLGARRFLGKIPEAELLPWLAGRFAAGGFTAGDEALAYLLATAEEVPYDIQKLAQACWTRLSAQRLKKLTVEIVAASCRTLIEEDGELYAHSWNQLTPYQKIALIEARRERGVGLTARQTLKRSKLNASTMRKALEALRNKGILREEEKPNETRWRFEDPLFGMWVERLTAEL